jgi:hypothetical protein
MTRRARLTMPFVALIVLMALSLSGCAPDIALKHPDTGQTVVCGGYSPYVPGQVWGCSRSRASKRSA